MRGATSLSLHSVQTLAFQSTRPMRGATTTKRQTSANLRYFNPRAPCGARQTQKGAHMSTILFQSTRPMRGATFDSDYQGSAKVSDFNPRAPCGARRRTTKCLPTPKHFNPRAPCGARLDRFRIVLLFKYFNPRAPCGARPASGAGSSSPALFQSTRPMRGATSGGRRVMHVDAGFQSTRPMRGATVSAWQRRDLCGISIHAPHAGRDVAKRFPRDEIEAFQSTRPMRGATPARRRRKHWRRYFNPRAPCGARHD